MTLWKKCARYKEGDSLLGSSPLCDVLLYQQLVSAYICVPLRLGTHIMGSNSQPICSTLQQQALNAESTQNHTLISKPYFFYVNSDSSTFRKAYRLWRAQRNENLRGISPRLVKVRRHWWAGHVARIPRTEVHTQFRYDINKKRSLGRIWRCMDMLLGVSSTRKSVCCLINVTFFGLQELSWRSNVPVLIEIRCLIPRNSVLPIQNGTTSDSEHHLVTGSDELKLRGAEWKQHWPGTR
jgi:hypothetical protein